MCVRDFRKAFRTGLTAALVPEPTILLLMGHSVDVSQGYNVLTREVTERAILSLLCNTNSELAVHPNRAPAHSAGQAVGA